MKIINFFNRTYQQLAIALHTLSLRYRTVRIHRNLKNGFYMGWFVVSGFIKH
jgi:hypothetical protein